ncbi:unnamed protein product [Symbiodinium sp. CCMP2592]|nr:unnamed protein product [Symbiodinium sp. CCMP2592]
MGCLGLRATWVSVRPGMHRMASRSVGRTGMGCCCILLLAACVFGPCYLGSQGTRGISIRCRSHSKPEDVPPAKRERMLQRPRDTFRRHNGHKKRKNKDLYFGNWPLVPSASRKLERDPKLGHWRARLKKERSPKDLLKSFRYALRRGEVDASVVSCAMQNCGYHRWWETLLKIHEAQEQRNITRSALQSRIFLIAMASCLKDHTLADAILAERREQGLQLGKSVWEAMPTPTTEFDFNPAISGAWSLCIAVGPEALEWAKQIFAWSETVPITKDSISYGSYLSALESCGQHGEVDALLRDLFGSGDTSAHPVLLGDLVNLAGTSYDSRRADRIWKMLVNRFGAKPNCICYVAYAKANLLSARPAAVVRILDRMTAAGLGYGNAHAALLYLQSLLLVCHSSPTTARRSALNKFLRASDSLDVAGWSYRMRSEWKELLSRSTQLVAKLSSTLTLHDILVLDNARRLSVMANWPNYAAGSKYLPRRSAKRPTSQSNE